MKLKWILSQNIDVPCPFMAIRILVLLIALLLQFASTAKAEEAVLADDVEVLRTCLEALKPNPTNPPSMTYGGCIWRVANPCQGKSEYADTPTIVRCIMREVHGWEVLLKKELASAIEVGKFRDSQVGISIIHERSLERALREGQVAWLNYRKTQCLIAGARGGGTISPIRGATCLARMTADRTLFLRGLSQGYLMER